MQVDRPDVVLAAMVAGGKVARYNAVQVENLLLLIDREAADEIGGPYFAFVPSKYGPYDVAVLETVERLAATGSAVIDEAGPYWICFASEAGYDRGACILAGMPAPVRRYLRKAARWILTEPFWSMMAGIYRRYPEMAVTSRIPQSALRDPGRTRMHPFVAGMASLVGIFSRRLQVRSGVRCGGHRERLVGCRRRHPLRSRSSERGSRVMFGQECASGRANEPDPSPELKAYDQPLQPGTAKLLEGLL